jgi:hypothetical protein
MLSTPETEFERHFQLWHEQENKPVHADGVDFEMD